MISRIVALAAATLSLASPLFAQTSGRPIRLEADASEITRGILHAKLTFDAPPGPLTLYYPKWIPGTHRPSGAIENLTGIVMSAGGRSVPWERDTIDNYTFHVTVPRGAGALDVRLDYVNAEASHAVASVSWNQVVLYPAGVPARRIQVAARLVPPAGWETASALGSSKRGERVAVYPVVDLVTLVDSPVLMGAHVARIALSDSVPREELVLACDSEEGLQVEAGTLDGFRRLVREARALFGDTPYRRYLFLTGLSDEIPSEGLEHHECTDIRWKERFLVDKKLFLANGDVFAHEMVHSWNGKARRPSGLAFTDYQHPENAELLWVYEGLTQYLGYVLTGRSGLFESEDARQQFAFTAGSLETRPGRRWRNVKDTAIGTGPLRQASRGWSAWRRGQDYYGEGALVWLEADATIRRLSDGKRSLDDFCRAFFGGMNTPEVRPYAEGDVVAALNAVQPYDWRRFLDERIDEVGTPTPTRSLEAAGWRLVSADSASRYESASQSGYKYKDLRASLGIRLDENGVMTDVHPDMAGAKAGLAPGVKILGVDGRKYSFDALERAITSAKKSQKPIELLVEDHDFYRLVAIDYHEGAKHPGLARLEGHRDWLTEILKPKVASTPDARR